jgi:hypothetical protein
MISVDKRDMGQLVFPLSAANPSISVAKRSRFQPPTSLLRNASADRRCCDAKGRAWSGLSHDPAAHDCPGH